MTSTPTRHTPQQRSSPNSAQRPITSFPAPKQLATPSELTPYEVRTITEAINPLIADAFALYTKTKNFHWHVSGPHFRDYHLLLEEQAAAIFSAIDTLAERLRSLGATTIRSITHISQLQTIPDDGDEFVPATEMMRRLLDDNLHVAEKQRAAIAVCDKQRDSVSANVLQEILNQTERRVWYLYEIVEATEMPRY